MADETTDDLDILIEAARQVIDTERALAGDILAADRPALPEPSAAPAAAAAACPPGEKAALLAAMAAEVAACTRCPLCNAGRIQTVFGEGDPNAELMFVGEGPGAEEDQQGRPFVGRSGQKLTEMIHAMGVTREQVYIANVVKCRPPGNRIPAPEEAQACWSYLQRQIEIIAPRTIVVLGNAAAKALLNTTTGITALRGQWQELWGIPVMPTFHPAYLLRQYTPENRRRVWSDLQAVMDRLGW
ncbi:MAG: uracil-DNA glycosylase, partial [Planctomycetes bacterium]|nr:uracil-DNA glycosylase [Planctomycetota bacterium]